MTDLDFDELDRAVSSLMSNVPQAAPRTEEKQEKTLDLTPSFSDKEATTSVPSQPTPTPTAPQLVSPQVSSVSPLPKPTVPATRRSGRFMDMVRSSSDTKRPELSRPVSRQGMTIEPADSSTISASAKMAPKVISDIVRPATATKASSDDIPEPTSLEPPTPLANTPPIKQDSVAMTDWPDPLDMTIAPSDERAISPFLSDAKVEKRPLGGAQPQATEEAEPMLLEAPEKPGLVEEKKPDELLLEAGSTDGIDAVAQLPANPVEVAPQVLPEELQGDLMAIEADTTHDALKQKHDMATAQTARMVQPKAEESVPTVPDPEKEPSSVLQSTSAIESRGPTSIPQQYREQPNTGDQDNGAIYDTKTYHQPIARSAKKKSNALWIVWIAIVLLLGAAGGAAVYFLRLV